MKNFTLTKAFALSLLCVLPAAIAAKSYDNDYRNDADNGGAPIYCNGFSVQVTGGIAPTLWNKRDCWQFSNSFTSSNFCPVVQLSSLGTLPKFNSIYSLPWDVGFRIAWGLSDRMDIGFDFDYRQARSKGSGSDCCGTTTLATAQLSFCYTTSLAPATTNSFAFTNVSKYKAYAGHVSLRWYTERYWCDSVAFFVGLKVGFVHHKEIDATVNLYSTVGGVVTASAASPYPLAAAPLYLSNTTISAGGTVGLDYCFWNRLSFIAQAEFLGQGPLRANHNLGGACVPDCNTSSSDDCTTTVSCVALATSNASATTNLVVPNFNCEIVFPITFGLKYYF